MTGHLFIVRGDLLHLACDAILVPSGLKSGRSGHITSAWRSQVPHKGGFVSPAPSSRERAVRVREASATSPSLWLGHTGERGGEHPRWYAGAIEAFIDAASQDPVHPDRVRPIGDGRPVLGIPLVGIGAGGMATRKGQLVMAVVAAVLKRLGQVEADVVLVVPGASEYAAAQQARAQLVGTAWDDVDPLQAAEIDRVAGEARRGRLVLFMGAGTGVGAGLPTWKRLLSDLGEAAGMSGAEREELDRLDPRDAGEAIQRRLGDKLPQLIASMVTRSEASLVHHLLASLPVTEAVTTNYDELFERCWAKAGRSRFGVLPHRPSRTEDPWLLKLHGCVTDPDHVVLSRGDYLRLEGRGAALAGLVQAMLLTRHMLFVGYSLSDDNFHRIAHQVRGALDVAVDRPGAEFATTLTPDPLGLSSDLWRDEVRFVSTADAPAGTSPVRQMAILLDRLGSESSAHMAHLLEPSYKAVFSKRELKLRKLLEDAREVAQEDEIRPALGQAVLDALAGLGGTPPSDALRRT